MIERMVNSSGGDMTVERLTVLVILCAGLGMADASAEEVGEPIAVAVPVSNKAPVPAEEAAAPDTAAASLEEEYMPLDLPARPDEPDTERPPVTEEMPEVESAVLGLEGKPVTVTYFVHARIQGIPNSDGVISASLCKRKNFTKKGCRTLRVPAQQGHVSVSFSGVAPGAYAVQVHHDQNDNGKMDFTFFGLPKEPYGFSRDAKPLLAPPKFDSASFEVSDGDISLVINLQNT